MTGARLPGNVGDATGIAPGYTDFVMPALYYVNVTIHVLAAMLWLGGMFFLAVVGAPALRAVEAPAVRRQLFQELGLRFRRVAWWTIATLIATGVVNLYYRGWLHWAGVFASPAFWTTAVGQSLAVKLGAVTAMVALSAIHDFWIGPLAGRVAATSLRALALRRWAALLARANGVLGIIVVVAAVQLARGV